MDEYFLGKEEIMKGLEVENELAFWGQRPGEVQSASGWKGCVCVQHGDFS